MRTRIPHLPHLIRSAAPTAELVPDRDLLAEFVTAKCGMAFELLVRRHGPAVWAVCRRHLVNTHDAEDAFQATFLVLAKSAKRIANTGSVGSWLYRVAYRVALKARRGAARRKRVEAVVSPTDEPVTRPVLAFSDTTAVVHAELEKLPDRYRLPLLLCDLEGLSRKEASAQLGWSEGTLSGRLNRARKLLAGRLSSRGVAAAALVGTATVSPTQAMTAAAVGVGLNVIGTSTTAAPETVSALAHGAMRDMTRSFVLKAAGVALAASVLLGGGLFGLRFDTAPQATAAPVPKVEMAKAGDVTDALVELVSQSAVQRELKLSAEQRVAIIDGFDTLNEKWEKSGRPVNPRFRGGQAGPSPDEFAAWENHEKGSRELVAGVITKGQFARLQQCEVQVLGTRALLLKRVQDELGLSDEQKKAVTKAMTPEPPQNFGQQGGQFGGQQAFQQLPLPNAAAPAVPLPAAPEPGTGASPDDVLQELTAGQQKRWKELNGEKVGFNRQRVAGHCVALFTQLHSASATSGILETVPPPTPPVAVPGVGPATGAPSLPPELPLPVQPVPPPANPGK